FVQRCRSIWSGRFERQCRSNYFRRKRQVKMTKTPKIEARKSAAEPSAEIGCKLRQQFLSVTGACRAFLLKLYNPSPDLPVGRGHECIDGPRRGAAGCLEQLGDAAD